MRPELNADELHIFDLELDVSVEDCLDESERQRAARFVFERDRRRFVAAHAQLRQILRLLTGREPGFTFGARGKPFTDGLQLNLSHSADRALVALHLEHPVGVDIEQMRPDVEYLAIAERMFSPAEKEAVRAAPDVAAAFYRVWTGKEAFIKLLGEGLAFPLDAFDVSLDGRLTNCRLHDPARFWMRPLACAPGFAAAVAVEGPPPRIWRWRYRSGTVVPDDDHPGE